MLRRGLDTHQVDHSLCCSRNKTCSHWRGMADIWRDIYFQDCHVKIFVHKQIKAKPLKPTLCMASCEHRQMCCCCSASCANIPQVAEGSFLQRSSTCELQLFLFEEESGLQIYLHHISFRFCFSPGSKNIDVCIICR